MAGKVTDYTNQMFASLGAMQTLIENFPMNLIKFKGLNFAMSFDIITIVLKMIGVEREEIIQKVTDVICGNMKDTSDGSGFISYAEDVVKIALEANITNILNCSTNPIISNKLLDCYGKLNDVKLSGEGINLNVAEINFTGVLDRNPFYDSKFFFDVEDRTVSTLYQSKDFNAFLWYIINKSDKYQTEELIWDDRYKAQKKGVAKTKDIIRCTYTDEDYPKSDTITVQLCGGREDASGHIEPKNYYKTRRITDSIRLNKTIFEFNHDFLMSIKLYEPKVIAAEIIEYLLGEGNLALTLGFSLNEQIIQAKVENLIKKAIELPDKEIDDCYFSFSNEEFNIMLEESERNRHNLVFNGDETFEVNARDILNQLSGITSNSELVKDKAIIKQTINEAEYSLRTDPSVEVGLGLNVDWGFDLLRSLIYPFVRPLFTPKVIFLLLVNKKIMGQIDETLDLNKLINDLLSSLFIIIKDIITKLKDLLIDVLLQFIIEKLTPILALFASKLLLESLKLYKDLLESLLKDCSITLFKFGNNRINGGIDDVTYAEITTQETPNQETIC